MLKRIAVVASLAVLTLPGFAQSNTPQFELFGGFQFFRQDTTFVQDQLDLLHAQNPAFVPAVSFGAHQNLKGWNGTVQENVNSWLGGVADFSGNYYTRNISAGQVSPGVNGVVATNLRLYTLMGGPQFSYRHSSRIQPFARALIGAAFLNITENALENHVVVDGPFKFDDTGFAVGAGGGADFWFSRWAGLRFSADYLRTYQFSATMNNIRGSVGLVFRIGSR
jgi:opacity protein-like surface antigen